MVKKLGNLSKNLVTIINTLITNQTIVKYVYYNVENPLAEADIMFPQSLIKKYFFPTPFDSEIDTGDVSSIRVFYLRGDLGKESPIGEDTKLVIDIVVAKNNWLINDGESKVRPYEIASEIVDLLDDVSIDTVGKLHFKTYGHMFVNKTFDGFRLIADMHTYH